MSKEKLKYSMLIEWDDEGECYMVTLPEWISETNGRHIVHGDTYEEAAKAGKEILESLVEVARNEGDTIPEPAVASDEDEEWPTRWIVKELDAEIHALASELKELQARIERIEKGLPIEQFIKGLNLLGYRLSIDTIKTEGENNA